MRRIVLIIHNVRSAHNVGSLLRTADGLGVSRVLISGYSPFPPVKDDARLPHVAERAGRQIAKTALGAETSVAWEHIDELGAALKKLSSQGYKITALEQTPQSVPLNEFSPPYKIALIVGNEVEGLDEAALNQAQVHLMVPMLGKKESFNVSVAAAMALYHLRYS